MKDLDIRILTMDFTLEGREEIRVAAVSDDEMIGMASVVGVGKEVETIYQLFVVPTWRRRGSGKAIVNHIEMGALNRGAAAVSAVVLNDGPLGWWISLGYQVVHIEPDRFLVSKRL